MKPNGKYFAVRAVLFVACAVGSFSAVGKADSMRGTFKLSTETRWGMIDLSPGEYEFTVDTESSGRVVTVKAKETRWSGMIMAEGLSETRSSGSQLEIGKSDSGAYVKALYLSSSGIALKFGAPKNGRSVRLTKSIPASVASAAGTH